MDIDFDANRNDHRSEYHEEAISLISGLVGVSAYAGLQTTSRNALITHVEKALKANYLNSADFEKEIVASGQKGYHKFKPQVVADAADYILSNIELSTDVKEKLNSIRSENAFTTHSPLQEKLEANEELLHHYLTLEGSGGDLALIKAKHPKTYAERLAKVCDVLRTGEVPATLLSELGLSQNQIYIVSQELKNEATRNQAAALANDIRSQPGAQASSDSLQAEENTPAKPLDSTVQVGPDNLSPFGTVLDQLKRNSHGL